jgi:DNA-binding transcriptional ArsR family regulator
MKHLLDKLDKALDNRIRLAIAALLTTDDKLDFTTLRDALELTDGNLSSHLSALEKAGYLSVSKRFQARKPLTEYKLTKAGRLALARHLAALEQLIQAQHNLTSP